MRSSSLALLARCVLVLGAIFGRCVASSRSPGRFLLVSTPRSAKIGYARILGGGHHSPVETLISSGLIHPQGLAIDAKRSQLLVADPDARRIFAYHLHTKNGRLLADEPTVAAEDVEARWVAVDGLGNMFFSDEPRNQILKVSYAQALRGEKHAEVVYDGVSLSAVNAPGGIAVDTFYTYWVNKHIGSEVGSVARGSESPDASNAAAFVQTLASNSEKSYGVCVTLDNVYYTQPSTEIFGVKKSGGAHSLVSDKLTNPRGCAWDGEGTVYVADRGANAIYSFAGNMKDLREAEMTKAVDFEDAFGLAVFSGSKHLWPGAALLLAYAACAVGAGA